MRMPTSTTEAKRRSGDDGFTLLELLAVLAIIALAVTAFTFGGQRTSETARFRAFLTQTSAMLRDGRAHAMRSMTETVVRIDLANRTIAGPDGSRLNMPPGVELDALVAGTETKGKSIADIRFYPAGNASGAELSFSFRNQSYLIRVNWLTGNVTSQRS
jgi:general secretion pathway protein H